MTELGELERRRDKYFSSYKRGLITEGETVTSFIQLLSEAPDDASALSLCADIPDWFRRALLEALTEMAGADYYFRTFGFEDRRTREEVHCDALQRQRVLLRLVPQMLTMLE